MSYSMQVPPNAHMLLHKSLVAIEEYCAKFNLDLPGAFEEKMAYNATRFDHTIEARKAAGGKKF